MEEHRVAARLRVRDPRRGAGQGGLRVRTRIIVSVDGEAAHQEDPFKLRLPVYDLRKFMRSNAGTCINQKPIVKLGQKIKKGDVSPTAPAPTRANWPSAATCWWPSCPGNGYNFEDAILISERMVKEDVYTSIHIEEFECGARDTKLGPEEITRDIPNVGEEALKNLATTAWLFASAPR
jgi:DNA-directed RNA polymerase subunit beta